MIALPIALPVFYVAAFGSALRLYGHACLPHPVMATAFKPLIHASTEVPRPFQMLLRAYADVFAEPLPQCRPALRCAEQLGMWRKNESILDSLAD
jgi:hypothetical protein